MIIVVIYFEPFLIIQHEIQKFPSSKQIAVIVNDSDPLSIKIATYYQQARNIPAENIIHVNFKSEKDFLDSETFENIFKFVKENTPSQVQGYVLTWMKPYRVGCMSITMAFATGYDLEFCPKKIQGIKCKIPKNNPFYAQHGVMPWNDYKLRPTMLLAAETFDLAKELIDRGVASDSQQPDGTAYLLSTSDKNRNIRARKYDEIQKKWYSSKLQVKVLNQDFLLNEKDVMFYFTGKAHVKHLDTLKFIPGAVADHLTSFGGQMKSAEQGGQMSSLRWLESGATGSYG
ncbi:MAG: TIGR03790 family protein, partial [Gammaproteobacteria bacterium]|nr:TIGR03790 family protein [Gammaproteobacteria bacterium]